VTAQAQLILEWLHIESDRLARLRLGVPARQDQNVVQASMRLSL
jgi:hypothetical protein